VELFNAYIAWDRALAIQQNMELPSRTQGAALFADISGFTPLTKALARALGPRRGVEELSIHLNRVYTPLVAEVHRFGGSVIAFAGDAITCWFDGDLGVHAVAAGLSIQRQMAQFAKVTILDGSIVSLAVKASVASGPARRFIVGDVSIQRLDVLAGETLERMAAAAGVAAKGELILDAQTAESLKDQVDFSQWRLEESSGQRFAVVEKLRCPLKDPPRRPIPTLSEAQVHPWILKPVFSRLASGQGEFLTELRPAVPIFLKFDGIDYDGDDRAGEKLSAFIGWVQRLLTSYGGFLIDVAVGDKGSYLYCSFGAPITHENDVWRALTVSAQLRNPPLELSFISIVQIGISRGMMRTGAYGGTERRTYGVLGPEVNMAARLMEKAKSGQVLVTGSVREDSGTAFLWEDLAPMLVKGNSDPISVSALLEPCRSFAYRVNLAGNELPLVGRVRELNSVDERIRAIEKNRGQALVLVSEAGLGKSRLAREIVRRATDRGFISLVGQCVSHGTQTSYLAWWSVWSEFFHLDLDQSTAERIASLETQLAEVDKALLPRLPLLGAALNLTIPDNEVTVQFDAKLRKASLEALLADCVRHRATNQRLLFFLEDAQWMDPLSADLLEVIGRAVQRLPVMLLVTRRPPDTGIQSGLVLESLANSWVVRLENLAPPEAAELLKQKIGRMFGPQTNPSPNLLTLLIGRSEGNPFYLEELLNFLKAQGVSPEDPKAAGALELPNSLHSLILSRIDQLTESQKTSLKMASVVGRVFSLHTLLNVNRALEEPRLTSDLEQLDKLELTPLEHLEPDPTYVFKHGVTQEVAYESLPFETRAKLHRDIGNHLEATEVETNNEQLDLLAYHFDRSDDLHKKRDYLLKAGQSAQARYANASAIDYYRKVLPLLSPDQQIPVLIQLGQVLELVGKWPEAGDSYQTALQLALNSKDLLMEARCRSASGELLRKEGKYVEALQRLEEAQRLFEQAGDEAGQAEVLHLSGTVNAQRGEFERATALYNQSMAIRERRDDKRKIASLLSNLGIIAWFRDDLVRARELYESSLSIRRSLGDRWSIANSLNNLALLLGDLSEFAAARNLLEECLAINRELGDRWSISNALSSLADVALDQGDYATARNLLTEGASISRELGDRVAISFILEQFAQLAVGEQQARFAFTLAGAAANLRESIGTAGPPNQQARLKKWLDKVIHLLPEADRDAAQKQGRALSPDSALDEALAESPFNESTQ
jgi:adenylate cyclase